MYAAEQEIKADPLETAIYYDEDGNELGRQQGDEYSVDVDLPAGTKVLTHNHPNASSLSRGDILFLMSTPIQRIRAIGADGIIYEAVAKIGADNDNFVSNFIRTGGYWAKAQELAKKEVEEYAYNLYKNDPDFRIYWKIREQRLNEVQKIFGKLSDRTIYHLVNGTEAGQSFTYNVIK